MISIFWYSLLPHLPHAQQKAAGSARQMVWSHQVAREPCCATTHPLRAGSVCALAPRLSALVGNNTHAHPTCKSDSVVCLSQGYGSVSQPAGRASQPHTCKVGHHDAATSIIARSKPPSSYVVVWPSQGTEGDLRCPSGVTGLSGARDGCLTRTRTHPRSSRSRPGDLGEETELVRLSQ